MATKPSNSMTGNGKLLFGAGFVFGVMVTLVLFGVVLAVVTAGSQSLQSSIVLTIAAGVVFAAIVGGGLYVLAFPENRTRIPVDGVDFGLDDEE